MVIPSFHGTPQMDSELFARVSDDELALLEYYRALKPGERAAMFELLNRIAESARQARKKGICQ